MAHKKGNSNLLPVLPQPLNTDGCIKQKNFVKNKFFFATPQPHYASR